MVLTILLCVTLKTKIKVVRQSHRGMCVCGGGLPALPVRSSLGDTTAGSLQQRHSLPQLCCLWGPFPGGSSENSAGTEPQEHAQYMQGFGCARNGCTPPYRHVSSVKIKAVLGIIFYSPTPYACWTAAACHTTGAGFL